ncbi:ABC transporter ATP-binding protein [Nocardioides jishulii]|uniref:ABC transporter ATP-binding protein n=1 Tax=Nocardioides jishulii TaxID=2575440 RepID=A0A4U2YI19_9ACTN|nr:ABC transporter ATP-binding protein [Nocardioides jishulii]QCX28005.1 ABC transporter ATP-binding protein [Nocardioides jishulii]TKI60669.1 ABC transporter ATP-binding protein [Nocardioides jishulii]
MTATALGGPHQPVVPADVPPAVHLEDVTVSLPRAGGDLQILHGVSFKVPAGSIVALAGESGSGKSTAALSLMRLLPWGARVGGRISVGDRDVATMSREELRQFRASEARIILQDPWSSLHPMHTVGAQLVESARAADPSLSKKDARALAVETMARVRIPDPESRLKSYPHEMSGGQLQRVLIAMALVARPTLLLCDEPTTALDVSTQAQILELLLELNREMGLTIVIATHDLDVIAGLADRLVVMYAGRVVEEGPTAEVMAAPRHPYTWALLQTAPKHNNGERMRTIEGRPPALDALPPGCAFADRCEFTTNACRTERPELLLVDEPTRHRTACLRVQAENQEA